MSGEFDSAFRVLISAGLADKTQGAVDGPVGHLSALTLQQEHLVEGSNVFNLLWLDGHKIPPPGLYIIHENELGILVAFQYDKEGDREADWANAEAEELSYYEEEESF
jgi:hypothetical protein